MKLVKQYVFQGVILTLLAAFVLPGYSLSAAEVYKKVKGSIFTLYTYDNDSHRPKGRGTAVAIDKDLLATNCHVALSGDYVVTKIDKKRYVLRLIYKNEKKDLCLLAVPKAMLSPVEIRPSNKVNIGENVYAIGNPRGSEKTISRGIISNKIRVSNGVWLETDAAIYYGSSGGGLFDEEGRLIGITSKMGGRFGFALPTEWILAVISPDHQLAKDESTTMTAEDEQEIRENEARFAPEQDYSRAHANLKLLGTYGKDNVHLYRNNSECFISLPALTTSGDKAVGLALWNPSYPQNFVIFANASNVKEALEQLFKSMLKSKHSKPKNFASTNHLIISGNPYNLYGSKISGHDYAFYVAHFRKSPQSMLEKVDKFEVRFNSDNPEVGKRTVIFKTDGFHEALTQHKKLCPNLK